MDHDIATLLLADLVTPLIAAAGAPGPVGEWVVPVTRRAGRRASGPAELHEVDGAIATEASVPDPTRITVANRSGRDVVVYAGAVLRGGFADRAVVRTAVVPAGGNRVVSVEPLEPRWWPSGPLLPAGMVEPVRAALLELGDRPGALASRARTAMWSAHRDPPAAAVWSGGGSSGWILVTGGAVAAANLHPPRASGLDRRTDRPGPRRSEPGAVVDLARSFLVRLLTEVEWTGCAGDRREGRLDRSAIRLTPLGGAGAHLTAVRLTDELTTATVLRSMDPARR